MQVAWELNEARPVHPSALAKLKVSSLTDPVIKKVFDHTIAEFDKVGATDKNAKADSFTNQLKDAALVRTSSLTPNKVTPQPEGGTGSS